MEPMVDQRLEDLKRRQQADPDNTQLQFELLNARARIEGATVYLELLEDRLKWNACHESVQDMAISFVGKEKLGSLYKHVETKKYSCGGQSHRIASFKHLGTGILLNLIPGGTYVMGDDKGEAWERPAHKATIKPMLIGRFPVTQEEWQKIGGKNPSRFKGAGKPVEEVSWDDVQGWLKKAGDGLRLPSESEWEYACRSGTQTQYFWAVPHRRTDGSGDKINGDYCWYDENSGDATHPVTAHANKTNAFGLVDMSGNVWEWCQDQWVNDYENGPRDSQPRTSNSSYRVIRGGCWRNDASYCRSADRSGDTPTYRNCYIGFRVARTFD